MWQKPERARADGVGTRDSSGSRARGQCARWGQDALESGWSADTEEHVFTRMLKNWADDFLTLRAEVIDALRKIDGMRLILSNCFFHAARELPKTICMSTL